MIDLWYVSGGRFICSHLRSFAPMRGLHSRVLAMENEQYLSKRRYKRRALGTKMIYFQEGRLEFGICAQVSEGGMLLHTKREVSMGTALELNFFLPNGSFIKGIGRVIYISKTDDGYAVGL